MSDYEVTLVNDNSELLSRTSANTCSSLCYATPSSSGPSNCKFQTDADLLPTVQEFFVRFKGPEETPFAGGLWRVHVELPDQYPYKSPSIGFCNRIFHPNIDELCALYSYLHHRPTPTLTSALDPPRIRQDSSPA